MVAMAHPNSPTPDHAAPEGDDALSAIEEVIAEFGIRATITACLKSSAGDEMEKLGGNATLRIAQVIIREIAFSRNPQLEAEIMALGTGVLMEQANMTRIAKKWGITKQALSKRVVRFVEENNLPPSVYMRSEKDRATYALTNQPRAKRL